MNRKAFFLLITVIFLSASNLYAQSSSSEDHTPEPYDMSKVPLWAKELRRTEIIMFGSLPFVTLGVALGFSIADYIQHNFDSAYFPNPFVKNDSYSTERQVQIIAISCFTSIGLGLVNLIINIIKYSIQKQKKAESGNINIRDLSDDTQTVTVPERAKRPKDYLFGNIESAVY